MTAHTILWLSPDKPDNISVGRQRIIDHLQDAGFEVTLKAATPHTIPELLRNRSEYDVIVGTTRAGALLGAVLKLLTGTPLVVDHIDPISQFEETNAWWLAFAVKHLEHAAFRLSDHTLYVYPEESERVQRFARSSSETNLGVEFDRFADPDDQLVEAARSRLQDHSVADDVAIYVGGLEPIYHIEAMIESLDHLDDWSLVILGSGSLEDEVARTAETRDDLHFLGTVPHEEVPGYLHNATVGVSLVDDPHTLKVLEYGAAELPTVQLAGRAEPKLGETVEYCELDPRSIAEAIERARGSRPSGLADVARSLSWASIAETYRTVLEQVTAASRN